MAFKRIVVVADFFVEDYIGGSEKSLDAILKAAPAEYEIHKVHSKEFDPSKFNPHKDFIVFGNFNFCTPEVIRMVTNRFKYAVIESDFKYCKYRLPEIHSAGAIRCICEQDPAMEHMRNVYFKSQINFFKSNRHLNRHIAALPDIQRTKNVVLSVTYTPQDLATLLDLHMNYRRFEKRWPWDKPVYGIYNCENWIKGKKDAIEYCQKNKIKYELILEKTEYAFQKKLATLAGFVFLPRGLESCSRMVIEAKIIGLDVILNNNVGCGGDEFINGSVKDIITFLKDRPDFFWSELGRALK